MYYGDGEDGTEAIGDYTAGKIYCDSKCETDFDDIRFTASDETTELSYWRGTKVDSSYAIFWVKVSGDIDADDVTIYIYYGNNAVSTTSDFDNTFIFGDPFDNVNLDTDRWPSVDGNPTYSIDATNHHLEVTNMDLSQWINGKGFHSPTTLSLPTSWMIDCPYLTANGIKQRTITSIDAEYQYVGYALASTDWDDDVVAACYFGDSSSSSYYYWWLKVGSTTTDFTLGPTSGSDMTRNTHIYKLGTNIKIVVDGVTRVDESNSDTPDRFHLALSSFATGAPFGTVHLGAFCIRKYVSPEPAHSTWGSEETPPAAGAIAGFSIVPIMQGIGMLK